MAAIGRVSLNGVRALAKALGLRIEPCEACGGDGRKSDAFGLVRDSGGDVTPCSECGGEGFEAEHVDPDATRAFLANAND